MGSPTTPGYSNLPSSVLNTDNTIIELKLRIDSTPSQGGSVLGILKPVWQKTMESELRIKWLKDMLERDLVLRDIMRFSQIIEEKLRTESSREEELGRQVLKEIMRIKLTDEKRHYRECRRIRECIRNYTRKKFGRKRYNRVMEKLKESLESIKREKIEKYRKKIEHLVALRESEKREKIEIVPSGLEQYSKCKIFNREEMNKLKPQKIIHKLIGDVKIDEEEKKVLDLSPKFAVMKRLDQLEMEQDVELGLGKLRYEITRMNKKIRDREIEETNYGIRRERKRIKLEEKQREEEEEIIEDAVSRQIFDPLTYRFNYSKRRATDLRENKSVKLPRGVDEKLESEMSMLRELVMREFNLYKREIEQKEIKENIEEKKRRNQEWRNLTAQEKRGLKRLKSRIENKEIVCIKTDKSGKLTLMKRDEYAKLGKSCPDKEINREELRIIERRINEHTRMWTKILNAGESHGHHDRITNSKVMNSEATASKYFMYKDHKKEGGYRPVVSGCTSNTLGLSNMLSDVVESLCLSMKNPFEIISSEDLLARIDKFNKEIEKEIEKDENYDWREHYILLGTDVKALFPSLSAERTGRAVRKQVEKSLIKWEEIDDMWLTLYVHLNENLCSSLEKIKHLLPKRRKGRRGPEAGMGSEECRERELFNDEKSNWEWPANHVKLKEDEKKMIMGAALEIATIFFFRNFTYSFGGKIFVQSFGGPIGARLTMCVARIVMQQWRDEFAELLETSNIQEKLSKIYVDDNRCITERLKKGYRFDRGERKFTYKAEWEEEDSGIEDDDRIAGEYLKAMNSINPDLEFTVEKEKDFENNRLPTLGFELWSTREKIRHSYYEKSMRSQVLTEKRSSQSENQKFAILTNEMNRRLQMMDEDISIEEKVEKIDHFTQQLVNSGYNWGQIREVIVSSLKGFLKKELKRKEEKKIDTELQKRH